MQTGHEGTDKASWENFQTMWNRLDYPLIGYKTTKSQPHENGYRNENLTNFETSVKGLFNIYCSEHELGEIFESLTKNFIYRIIILLDISDKKSFSM